MEHFTEAIKKMAEENPLGFTVSLPTLKRLTGGISVAYLETQNSFGDEGLKRVLKHALDNEKTVGGWKNFEDEQFYYDSVRIFTDLEQAKRFAIENRQLAIFDLTNLKLIWL
jgi:fructokinase